MHKAGSSYVGTILRSLFAASGFIVSDPCTTAFDAGLDEVQYVSHVIGSLAAPGTFSGPYRTASELVGLRQDTRPIVHIRDPRDCLVSFYYSRAFSHVLPPPGPSRDVLLHDRYLARSMTVDEYVLDRLPYIQDQLNALQSTTMARPEAVMSRYETMVTDFAGWITDIVERVELDVQKETIARLARAAEFKVQENEWNHKRQVTPGDFRRKLSSQTQNALTERLIDGLQYFGFDSAFV